MMHFTHHASRFQCFLLLVLLALADELEIMFEGLAVPLVTQVQPDRAGVPGPVVRGNDVIIGRRRVIERFVPVRVVPSWPPAPMMAPAPATTPAAPTPAAAPAPTPAGVSRVGVAHGNGRQQQVRVAV